MAELRTKKLPVKLTEREIREFGQRNAEAVRDLAKVERDKKMAMADFKEQIEEIKLKMQELSECINNREEWRQVEVRDERDNEACLIRTIRLDTHEVVSTRSMTPQEKQGVFESMLEA